MQEEPYRYRSRASNNSIGRVMRISAAGPTEQLMVSLMAQTPQPKGSLFAAQPALVSTHSHWGWCTGYTIEVQRKQGRKGDNGAHAFLKVIACLFFLLQHYAPGYYFLFCSLLCLMFVFARTTLQLLCINKSPIQVLLPARCLQALCHALHCCTPWWGASVCCQLQIHSRDWTARAHASTYWKYWVASTAGTQHGGSHLPLVLSLVRHCLGPPPAWASLQARAGAGTQLRCSLHPAQFCDLRQMRWIKPTLQFMVQI